MIVFHRNPKDSVVSLFHHAKSKPEFGYTGTFDEFVNIFLAGKAENGSWFNHVLGWYQEAKVCHNSIPILVMTVNDFCLHDTIESSRDTSVYSI